MRFILIYFLLFPLIASAEPCNQQLPAGFSFFGTNAQDLAFTKDLCDQHLKIFSNLKDIKSDGEQLNQSVAKSNLIILAEEHMNPYQRHYDKLFRELKKENSKINCVFLEFNKNNPEAQKLIQGKAPDELNFRQHTKIVEAAKASQTKVFLVDERDPNVKVSDDLSNYVRKSNEAIYKNVKALYDTKECQAGIILIGKAHVETSQLPIDPDSSLRTMFDNGRFAATAINLVYTGKSPLKDPRDAYDYEMNWKICDSKSQEFDAINKPIAISKQRLNSTSGMVISPANKIDYYLFMPKVEDKEIFNQ